MLKRKMQKNKVLVREENCKLNISISKPDVNTKKEDASVYKQLSNPKNIYNSSYYTNILKLAHVINELFSASNCRLVEGPLRMAKLVAI